MQDKAQDYGIAIEKLNIQAVKLPEFIQKVINAFLLPVMSEQEAEARVIGIRKELETYKQILGPEAFRINELLKNFKGSNFGFLTGIPGLFAAPLQQAGDMAKALGAGADSSEIARNPKTGTSG